MSSTAPWVGCRARARAPALRKQLELDTGGTVELDVSFDVASDFEADNHVGMPGVFSHADLDAVELAATDVAAAAAAIDAAGAGSSDRDRDAAGGATDGAEDAAAPSVADAGAGEAATSRGDAQTDGSAPAAVGANDTLGDAPLTPEVAGEESDDSAAPGAS